MADEQPAPSQNQTPPAASTPAADPPASAPPASATPPPAADKKDPPAATPPATPPVDAKPPGDKPPVDAKPPEDGKPPADAKPPEGEKPPETKPDVVPEKYELFASPGKAVDPELAALLAPVLKASNVTQANAQALVDAYQKAREAQIPRIIARDLAVLQADPELGGANFARTTDRLNNVLANFSTVNERDALSKAGLSNHPVWVRILNRIGAELTEAAPSPDAKPWREPPSRASKLYGGADLVAPAATQ